ncbi:hypothetical protein [Sphingobacterium faecium]|uniref:hypothetical protein n=1 Tax=Sphingobacterium faecium TaxID=34087 RepID=UPI000D38386B|nr:hypothetical protein [Sphingobacterium faecium]MQP29497.1 hypothetical protein [Sphingobacterium faecium]
MKKRKYKWLLRQKKEKLSTSPLYLHFSNTIHQACYFGSFISQATVTGQVFKKEKKTKFEKVNINPVA